VIVIRPLNGRLANRKCFFPEERHPLLNGHFRRLAELTITAPLGEACEPREGSNLHSLKAVINLIAKIVPKFTPQAQSFGKFPKK
jgi:hypothetical protein